MLQPAGTLGNLGARRAHRPRPAGGGPGAGEARRLVRGSAPRAGVELRIEAFNVFNRANYGIPSLIAFAGVADNEAPLPTFGRIRSTVTSARQVQAGRADRVLMRPASGEYAPAYAAYVGLVSEDDVLPVLAAQGDELCRLAGSVAKDRETFRYGEGKWSVREIFGHMGDGERVFGYRVFCIARGDQTPLPGFDENEYIDASGYDRVPLAELAADFAALRASNLSVLRRLPPERWAQVGTAYGKRVTVRALAYIMAGHFRHHLGVLKERYGVTA